MDARIDQVLNYARKDTLPLSTFESKEKEKEVSYVEKDMGIMSKYLKIEGEAFLELLGLAEWFEPEQFAQLVGAKMDYIRTLTYYFER